MMKNRFPKLLLMMGFLLSSSVVQAESIKFLHNLLLENHTNPAYFEDSGLVVSLQVQKPHEFLKIVNHPTAKINGNRLLFRLESYVSIHSDNSKSFLTPTFLIDFDNPLFSSVEPEILAKYGNNPGAMELTEFTFHLLAKTMDRIYDAASTVLKNKRGDCSEHAILLTALLRKYEFPARTIHGAMLIFDEESHQWTAFGHAWVEYLEGSNWKGLDASFNQQTNKNYIANFPLADESMSYSFGMMNQQVSIGIQKLKIEDFYTINP